MILYLDHAATTPMRDEALEAMMPYLYSYYGNPSGSHSVSRQARDAIEDARQRMSVHLGCDPGEVVFTAGGTESDNLAIMGVAKAVGGKVLCSAFEHRGVLAPCGEVGATLVNVDHGGLLDIEHFKSLLDGDVSLVSVMLVNNEVGTVQPIDEIVRSLKASAPQAVLHTDAVQAAAWMDLSSLPREVGMISVSGHKVGGPKGVGALVIREGTPYVPLVRGGSHERSRRPGTHNVAGIVSMAAAFDAAAKVRDTERRRVSELRDYLWELLSTIPGIYETAADRSTKAPGILSVYFDSLDQQDLLMLIDEKGVCASGGSACSSGAIQPSHVLVAMGYSVAQARGAVRFSLGHTTTKEEVAHAAEVVRAAVAQLRGDLR